MVRNKRVRTQNQKYAYIKSRISKAQGKAKAVGFLYLLGLVAIVALACLSLVTYKVSDDVAALTFSVPKLIEVVKKVISEKALNLPNYELIGLAIYAALLVVLLINLIRAFVKLGWLFKKKASRLYGVNRNIYAMDDLGKIFSSSFAWIITAHVVLMLLYNINGIQTMAYAFLGAGLFVHFVCGLAGGKVSLFSTEEGSIVEMKREVGRFTPFVRNLLQLAAVAAILYFVVDAAWFTEVGKAYKNVGELHITKANQDVIWQVALVYVWAAIIPAICVIVMLFALGMLRHATGTREFDMEGPETPGRKKFLAYSIFTVLFAVGLFAVQKFVQPEAALVKEFMDSVWIVAGIALAMAIIEIILVNCPKTKEEKELQKQQRKEQKTKKLDNVDSGTYLDDVDVNTYISENYNAPGVYINPYMQGVPFGIIAQQGQPQMQPQNYYVQQNKR